MQVCGLRIITQYIYIYIFFIFLLYIQKYLRMPHPQLCNAAAASNDHCTKLAEKNKHTKYDDLASKLDCRVVAAAFTTYGLRRLGR